MSISILGNGRLRKLLLTFYSGGEEEEIRRGLRRTRTCIIADDIRANRCMHIGSFDFWGVLYLP